MPTYKGKILQGVGGLYTVFCDDKITRQCRAKGNLKRDDNKAYVGDYVILSEGDIIDSLVLSEILPRKNSLIRPPVSNIDEMFITVACSKPAPILETIDKMTAILCHNKIQTKLVITKTEEDKTSAEELRNIYQSCGFPTYLVSSFTGEGIEDLKNDFVSLLHQGKSLAVCGASGVGKSTLLNALFPNLSQKTSSISEKAERGKHTTRTVDIFPMEEGYIVDTPGFSLLDFTRFDFLSIDELPYCFPECEKELPNCAYKNCSHIKEEDCGIRQAVKEQRIPLSRYQSFCSIATALKQKNPYGNK